MISGKKKNIHSCECIGQLQILAAIRQEGYLSRAGIFNSEEAFRRAMVLVRFCRQIYGDTSYIMIKSAFLICYAVPEGVMKHD